MGQPKANNGDLSLVEEVTHVIEPTKMERKPTPDAAMSKSKTVSFDGPGDRQNPKNWPAGRKILLTVLYGLTTMGATWSSAIYSTAVDDVATHFKVNVDIAQLGTSLLLIGFGTGPLLWAPLSEIYGRRYPVLVPYFICVCFTFGTAVAADFTTILVTRFLAGFFGSAPVSITSGALADMFDPKQRGWALLCYATAVVGGPIFAPVAGSAIVQYGLGWRWTQYVTGIYMFSIWALDTIFLRESYTPVLLVAKARRVRLSTGDWSWHAKHEEWEPTFKQMANKFLSKPLELLATPIGFLYAVHTSFVYSIVYLNLGAFPILFQEVRGWDKVTSSLPFLALIVGIAIGGFCNFTSQKFYLRKVSENDGRAVPEARLPPMMMGSVSLTVGLFLIGNCANTRFPWIVPVLAAVFMGFGFFTIFQAALNYLVDTFMMYAASAVAGNTFCRCIVASIFPPLVSRIYTRLGVVWASNMLGFIALAMVPIPWVFYWLGPRIRSRSGWSQRSIQK